MAISAADLKLIERIQKLHAMAESAKAVGSLAEAESFMEAVEKTLAKHNLDSSVLSTDTRDLRDPLTYACSLGSTIRHRNKPVKWAQILATVTAEAHFCTCLVSISSSHVFFYGRASNVDTAQKMFEYLRDMAERLGWRAYQTYCRATRYNRQRAQGPANTWYLDWLEGFAGEVGRRYSALRVRLEADHGMSLVLTGVRDEAKRHAKDSEMSPEEAAKKKRAKEVAGKGRYEAHMKGVAAAKDADLRPNVLDEHATDAHKMIGGGGVVSRAKRMPAVRYGVNPTYCAGSPAQVDGPTAWKVAREEQEAFARKTSSGYSDAVIAAATLRDCAGIVYAWKPVGSGAEVADLITGEVTRFRKFAEFQAWGNKHRVATKQFHAVLYARPLAEDPNAREPEPTNDAYQAETGDDEAHWS